jgi:hypothetical protein
MAMEDATWDNLLNDNSASGGVDVPLGFSAEQIEKITPRNSFEKLQRMADEVMAKKDKHSIGGIHRALESEIQKRNGF